MDGFGCLPLPTGASCSTWQPSTPARRLNVLLFSQKTPGLISRRYVLILEFLRYHTDSRHQFYGSQHTFGYKLVPFESMKASWSVRRYMEDPLIVPFNSAAMKYFVYPFSDLPISTFHVPLHFVIVNTGRKLVDRYGEEHVRNTTFSHEFPFLQPAERSALVLVRNIYLAWVNAAPVGDSFDALAGDDNGDSGLGPSP